ncbi:hypothetical protein GCM10007938_33970 [Vibrio zhanjiangensis]|uniref:Uncharacterized protein n=1 Tax=Vibrio zhanjiangensis TaxID=1046128 RepID=A0ABQ6F2D0_9VIBR|nr:hypothetical protein [Vibrio zhanjiangensis]GLT19615.1 hypothetical protein GCM10007938_33970 [Vibrio zhanjiangensis]
MKFQFYSNKEFGKENFTYLNMGDETFLTEKEQLIKLGFEVDGDVIMAESVEEAIEKYKSNFIYVIEDYSNSHPESALANFFIEMYKSIFKKKNKSN